MLIRKLLVAMALCVLSASALALEIDPINLHAFLLDDHPFTVAPCDGDPMPVIDIILEDSGNNPVEVIASDIWLDSPIAMLDFCWEVIADSSTFRPDPGHTTISGELHGGLASLAVCAAAAVDVVAIGSVIGHFELQVNSPDLTGDREVTVADFGLFAGWFGNCVCSQWGFRGAAPCAAARALLGFPHSGATPPATNRC